MLIKAADDKQPQIDALEALRGRPDVDAATRTRIDREIKNIRAGISGERDAAYEIDFHYANEPNRVVIHDLRLEVDGRVAQIDHLIVDRVLTVWVCESKHFAEGVGVNEHGEWVSFWGGRPRGIPSPIEQNRRHIAVLQDVFDLGLVDLPKRLGITIKPRLVSVVLVSNNARISRPKSKAAAASVDGLETVMKVENLHAAIVRDAEARGLRIAPRIVGPETIERVGHALVALHRPAAFDTAARFGLPPQVPVKPTSADSAGGPSTCASCARPLSAAEVAYLSAHSERFGGRRFCYQCQRSQPRADGVT